MSSSRPKLYIRKEHRLALVSSLKIVRNYEEMSDQELIAACQKCDDLALKHLLKRYERIIRNIVRKVAPDCSDTSDLEQEVYIRIWRSVGQLRDPRCFKTWLARIVTNLFYDELRKRPRNFHIVSIDEPVITERGTEIATREIVDSSPQPEDVALNRELSALFDAAMSSIADPFKTAFVLRDIEGLPYEEIAEITGSELGTVKSRISRARTKIQQRLNPYLRDCA